MLHYGHRLASKVNHVISCDLVIHSSSTRCNKNNNKITVKMCGSPKGHWKISDSPIVLQGFAIIYLYRACFGIVICESPIGPIGLHCFVDIRGDMHDHSETTYMNANFEEISYIIFDSTSIYIVDICALHNPSLHTGSCSSVNYLDFSSRP